MKKGVLLVLMLKSLMMLAQKSSDSVSAFVNKMNGDGFYSLGFPKNKLSVNTWFSSFSSSTALPSAFTNAFIFPSFIDESLKSNAEKRLNSSSRFGGELSSGIAANFSTDTTGDSKDIALGFLFNTQIIQTATFSKDAFKTIFEGNASYSDKVANFNNSGYFGMSYQTFKFSYLQRSKNIQFRVSAGIAHGLSTTQVKLRTGSLYSQSEGEYLDLSWNGNYLESRKGSNQLKNTPSFGPALDLFLQFRVGKKGLLSFLFQDLGFINWNEQTTSYESDTSFRFTGIQVSNLISFSDSTVIFGDTLLNALRGDKINSTYMQQLPTSFQLKYIHQLSEKWLASAAVQYRLVTGYVPFTSVQLARNFRNNRSLGLTVSYGGYGSFQTGLQAVLIQTEHHYLKLGTVFNEGFIVPKRLSGNGVMLSYSYNL